MFVQGQSALWIYVTVSFVHEYLVTIHQSIVVQSELDTCILHMNYCLIIDDGFFFLSVYSYAGACALKLCFGGVGCIDMFLSHVYVCADVRETMRDVGKIMNKSSTNFIIGLHNLQFNSVQICMQSL